LAFWLAAAAFAVAMFGTTLPTPLYPLYREQLHFAPVLITVIFAVYAVGVIVALLFFGRLSDRVGRRRVLFAGLALSALSAVAFLLAGTLPLLFIGRILSGFSAGIFTGAGTAAVTELMSNERRHFATAVAVAANTGGLSLGPIAAGFLAQFAGHPLQLPYAVDLLLLVPAAAGLWMVPETVEAPGEFRVEFQRLCVPAEVHGIFVRAAIVGFCGFAVTGVYSAVAPSVLGEVMGIRSPALAGITVFVVMAVAAVGQITVQRLPERLAFPLGCNIMIAGLVLLGAAVATKSFPLLLASSAATGLGFGLTMGFGLMQINAKVDERRGEVTSTYFLICYVGLIVPVVGVGLVAMATGLSVAAYIFCGLVAATVLGVAAFTIRSRLA
jgi:MFS family permease